MIWFFLLTITKWPPQSQCLWLMNHLQSHNHCNFQAVYKILLVQTLLNFEIVMLMAWVIFWSPLTFLNRCYIVTEKTVRTLLLCPLVPFLANCSRSVPASLCFVASYVFLFFLAVFAQISSCTWRRSGWNLLLQYLQASRSSLVTADLADDCLADGLWVDGALAEPDTFLLMLLEDVFVGKDCELVLGFDVGCGCMEDAVLEVLCRFVGATARTTVLRTIGWEQNCVSCLNQYYIKDYKEMWLYKACY